jgi:hypothetical protein
MGDNVVGDIGHPQCQVYKRNKKILGKRKKDTCDIVVGQPQCHPSATPLDGAISVAWTLY